MDMTAFVVPKSDQMNADDLIAGPRTITITKVSGTGNADQPVAVSFDGDQGKPFKPCKSMRRVMIAAWGPDASQYVGRSMTLYRDPGVAFGGMQVGGIRISHMTNIDREMIMALTVTKAKRSPYTVKPLKIEAPRAEAKEDKAALGAEALAARFTAAANLAALADMTREPKVVTQREWLKANRPELAEMVNAAQRDALARFEQDDTFPGDLPSQDVLADQEGVEA